MVISMKSSRTKLIYGFILASILVLAFFSFRWFTSDTFKSRQYINKIERQNRYISIEKEYTFSDGHSFYLYGLYFEDDNLKKPILLYTSNSNVSVSWMNPSVSGGGGEMIFGGKLYIEKVDCITPVQNRIELNIIFTDANNKQTIHTIIIDLDQFKWQYTL